MIRYNANATNVRANDPSPPESWYWTVQFNLIEIITVDVMILETQIQRVTRVSDPPPPESDIGQYSLQMYLSV